MTVAVGVEIGAGLAGTGLAGSGLAGQTGQGLSVSGAKSGGWTLGGAIAPTAQSTTDAESFRTRWQALLSSVDSMTGAAATGQTETESSEATVALVQPQSAAGAQKTTPGSRGGTASQWQLASRQVSTTGQAKAGKTTDQVDSAASLQSTTDAAAKTHTRQASSARESSDSISGQDTRQKTAVAGAADAVASFVEVNSAPASAAQAAAVSSPVIAIPAQAEAASATNGAGFDVPSKLTNPLADAPAGSPESDLAQPAATEGRIDAGSGVRALSRGGSMSLAASVAAGTGSAAAVHAGAGAHVSGPSQLADETPARASGLFPDGADTQAAPATQSAASSGQIQIQAESSLQESSLAQSRTQLKGGQDEAVLPGSAVEADQASDPGAASTSVSRAALFGAAKPGLTARQATEQLGARAPHTAGLADAAAHVNPSSQAQTVSQAQTASPAQSASPAADASAVVRDPASAHGTASLADGGSRDSAGASAGASGRETFGALDAGAGAAAPGWIHAGTHRAEAGYQDPALGWVGVRADLNGSGIHASLVPGSADAAQTLGGHMAGLHAYLAAEHSSVETVTLASPEGQGAQMSADAGSNQGTSQGTNQGAGQNSGQREPGQAESTPQDAALVDSSAAASRSGGESRALDGSARIPDAGGSRISVMA